jgi:pimeloyl-ACP methyl ester carboxylesterase
MIERLPRIAIVHALPALVCWLLLAAPAGAAPAAHEVSVDGHPIRVWEKSPPPASGTEGPRVVLIHGRTWSTLPDFDLQVPGEAVSLMDGLVERGMTAFGVDLRGYGETPRDDTGWLTPERAAADVAGVLEWLAAADADAPRPYLFGWSYGSMVSQLVAQQRPDLVSGIVLFGYPVRPGIDRDPERADGPPPRQETTAQAARSDFIVPGAISDRAVDAFVAAALQADPVRADWRRLDQWRALDGAAVRVPTLLLEAEHDPLALDDVHAELFSRLNTSDKAWVSIPGGDHAAFMETPRDYFLDVMETFIRRER